jgi:predicted TIM-barrel fold metal-dependent hydrolase
MSTTESIAPGEINTYCDCHAHVFGPFDRYPLSETRTYTPPLAPKADYLAMLDQAGFGRGVLVHPGANGWDQSAMLDALKTAPERLRGVAVVPVEVSDETLATLDASGVRGVRFTEVAGPTAGQSIAGRLNFSDLEVFAPRLKALGWHAQIWANCRVIEANAASLRSLGLPVVIDHLGFFDVSRGVGDPAFQALLRLVGDGVAWVKMTVFRNSKAAPGYLDVKPFHDALVAANPERLVWGSDWPFLGMTGDNRPSTQSLLAKLVEWVPDPAVRERILATNPAALYGFN